MGLRRKGREIAMQTLYSMEFETEEEMNIEDIAGNSNISDKKIIEFAENLLDLVQVNIESVDEKIQENSKNWSFDRIAMADKCILRIAAAEILFTETAHPIIINEAIEVSKKYCSESSGKFINGILHAISKGKVS